MLNETLVAVPLFIFMGVMLERSKIAEELLARWASCSAACAAAWATRWSSSAPCSRPRPASSAPRSITMGLISLPAMLRAGYDPRLATGVICASATLAQIIPPSTVLIFIGDILQGVNQTGPAAARQLSRRHRSRSATCSPARSCPACCWSACSCSGWPGRAWRQPGALPAAGAARGRAARRAAAGRRWPCWPRSLLIVSRAGLDPGRHRHRRPNRPRWAPSARCCSPPSAAGSASVCCARPCLRTALTTVDDLRHPARRLGVLAGVSRPGRRGPGRRGPARHAGRGHGCHGRVHGGDVRAGLLPRHVRDHLHHGADLRPALDPAGRTTRSGSA